MPITCRPRRKRSKDGRAGHEVRTCLSVSASLLSAQNTCNCTTFLAHWQLRTCCFTLSHQASTPHPALGSMIEQFAWHWHCCSYARPYMCPTARRDYLKIHWARLDWLPCADAMSSGYEVERARRTLKDLTFGGVLNSLTAVAR